MHRCGACYRQFTILVHNTVCEPQISFHGIDMQGARLHARTITPPRHDRLEAGQIDLAQRLLAANLVRDDSWDRGVARLVALGLPLTEVAVIIGSTGPVAGMSQQKTIEQLFVMGFESAEIHTLTGIPKTTVQPALSKLRAAATKTVSNQDTGTPLATTRSKSGTAQA